MHTSIVQFTDAAKALLPCCIPYLQPHNGRTLTVNNALCEKGGADGGVNGRLEGILDVSVDQRSLSHAL